MHRSQTFQGSFVILQDTANSEIISYKRKGICVKGAFFNLSLFFLLRPSAGEGTAGLAPACGDAHLEPRRSGDVFPAAGFHFHLISSPVRERRGGTAAVNWRGTRGEVAAVRVDSGAWSCRTASLRSPRDAW